MERVDPDWDESVAWLLDLDRVPAAQATGQLLQAAVHWRGRVVPRTELHDLVFTLPGAPQPFVRTLHVGWTGHSFEFLLTTGERLVAADHCGQDGALATLESLLEQLVADLP